MKENVITFKPANKEQMEPLLDEGSDNIDADLLAERAVERNLVELALIYLSQELDNTLFLVTNLDAFTTTMDALLEDQTEAGLEAIAQMMVVFEDTRFNVNNARAIRRCFELIYEHEMASRETGEPSKLTATGLHYIEVIATNYQRFMTDWTAMGPAFMQTLFRAAEALNKPR